MGIIRHMSNEKRARALARKTWPMVVHTLADEPSEDLSHTTTVEERLAMLWPLAKDAWAIMGQPLPQYERQNMPGRIFRPQDEQS